MKKSNNLLLKTLLLLFVLFLIFYISKGAGFYEYKAYTKSRLTSEAMEKFESDLAAGKDVTIEEYIQIGQTNYSNAVSKTGYKIGKNRKIYEYRHTKSTKSSRKTILVLFIYQKA